MDDQERVH